MGFVRDGLNFTSTIRKIRVDCSSYMFCYTSIFHLNVVCMRFYSHVWHDISIVLHNIEKQLSMRVMFGVSIEHIFVGDLMNDLLDFFFFFGFSELP